DTTLDSLIAQRDLLIEQARAEGMKTFGDMVASNALILVPTAVMNHVSAQITKQSLDELRNLRVFRNERDVAAHYDPEHGQMVGDASKVTPAELDTLKQAHAADLALKQQQLAKLLGTDDVSIVRTAKGAKTVVKRDGNAFVVEV